MKKRITIVVAGILAAALLVGAWAFYTSSVTLDNQMKTKMFGDTLEEKFTPDKDWMPGEEVAKEVGVRNTGDYGLVVRVKLNEQWWRDLDNSGVMDGSETVFKAIDSTGSSGADRTKINYTSNAMQPSHDGGTTLGPVDGIATDDETIVKKKMDNINSSATGWTLHTDGWWYYNGVLTAGNATSLLISSIMLAADADMGKYDVIKYWTEDATVATKTPGTAGAAIGSDSATGWVIYTGAVPSPTVSTNDVYTRSVSQLSSAAGYAGAVYDLFITSQTCQATSDAVAAAWAGAPTSHTAVGTGYWGF